MREIDLLVTKAHGVSLFQDSRNDINLIPQVCNLGENKNTLGGGSVVRKDNTFWVCTFWLDAGGQLETVANIFPYKNIQKLYSSSST